jgi:ATP-dependent DNA helicase RecQ
VLTEELSFNQAQYQKRRNIFIARATQMIQYIETTSCRSQFISQYFGDVKAKECGVCDNCLQRKRSPLSAKEFEKISSLMLAHISQNQLTADALLKELKTIPKEKAWKVLSFLQAEKKITATENGVLMLC